MKFSRKDIAGGSHGPVTPSLSGATGSQAGGLGSERKSFSSSVSAHRSVDRAAFESTGGAKMTALTGSPPKLPVPILYASLIVDSHSLALWEYFKKSFLELGRAGGTTFHYDLLGDPRICDDIYRRLRDDELADRDKADQKVYDAAIVEFGADFAHVLREMNKLAEILGVVTRPRPMVALFFTDPRQTRPGQLVTVIPIDPRVTDRPEWMRACVKTLCDMLSHERLCNLVRGPKAQEVVEAFVRENVVLDDVTSLTQPDEDLADGDNVFRLEGQFWTLDFGNVIVRVRDTRGMTRLARLLSHPNESFHVRELAMGLARHTAVATISADDEASVQAGLGDAGSILDAEAREQYRVRLIDLRRSREEAERNHDTAQLQGIDNEAEMIAAELGSAEGLLGRERKAPHADDRMRKAVQKSIDKAIQSIVAVHPTLGDHLRRSVHTGTRCTYSPADPVIWRT